MRLLRFFVLVAMIMLATGMSPAQPRSRPLSGVVQSASTGVFGFGEDEWTASGNAEAQDDGSIKVTLDDGSVVTVRLDDEGNTAFVGYALADPLSFTDGERFVVQELLPADAEYLGQYDDILPGQSGGAITVRLYESRDLRGYMADSSGIVVFAWLDDGTTFSVSVGRQG